MRNLKKHLEKIYRKVALKLVKPTSHDSPVSQEALHVSGAALSPSMLLVLKQRAKCAL